MKKLPVLFLLFIVFLGSESCNLENEIDIELPDYEAQIMVEGYLEPGQPYTLLLSKTDSYFAPFPTEVESYLDETLENDAVVTITHKGETITLENQIGINPFTGGVFNYVSPRPIPNDNEPFVLEITTSNGEKATATTQFLPVLPIDSLVVEFPEEESTTDTLARVLTYLQDPAPNELNYLRRMLNVNSLDSLDQDFVTDDSFIDSTTIVFGTGYDFAIGDTVYSTIYHIDEAYNTFLESVFNASASNGNPFAQPSTILSNLEGSEQFIGIFTALSYDRQSVIIEK